MYIDNRFYVDPIDGTLCFINPFGGNIESLGIFAKIVTNQLGGDAFETAVATNASGISRAYSIVQAAFPSVKLGIIDNMTAKQVKYRNVGGMNYNLSTSALWITMGDLAIVQPVAVLIRQWEERKYGKPLQKQMEQALEAAGIINQVIP
jgi:hypothetical protein